MEEQAENWEILELKLVECSGVCRIGGLGGRVLGAHSRERNREEGGQERLLAGQWSGATVSECAEQAYKDESHAPTAAHRTDCRGPRQMPCEQRAEPSSCSQRETRPCFVTSGFP